MRVVARLRDEDVPRDEVVRRAYDENLFQYPTLKMARDIARVCLARLDALGVASPQLTHVLADGPLDAVRQANLYAMMRGYRLVWDLMTRLVAERYETLDLSLTAGDLNVFLADAAAADPAVAAWSDATAKKLRQVLASTLKQAGLLAEPGIRSGRLLPVILDDEVAAAIRENGDLRALPAFDCLAGA